MSKNIKNKAMEEKLRQKIKEIVEERGLSVLGISDNQAQNRRLNRQINEGCAITLPTVFDILVKFPDISSEWLLRDEGRKYISDIPADGDSEQVLDLKAELMRKEGEVEGLRQTIADLKAAMAKREAQLDKLINILHEERNPSPSLSIVAEEPTYTNSNNLR
jgi:hypothetical protein